MTIDVSKPQWPPAMRHRTPVEDEIALSHVYQSVAGNRRREFLFREFKTFMEHNPEIVIAFETFMFEVIAAGKRVYSADALFHRVRWWSEIETRKVGDDFKLNNNHTAYLARFFMAAYPALLEAEFFKLRDPMRTYYDPNLIPTSTPAERLADNSNQQTIGV